MTPPSHNVTQTRIAGRAQRMRGVGLVEIMVALVVLSIGLLGVANLHLSSLRMTQEGYFHSQAALLAQDLIDRMRANPAAVDDGAYERAGFGAEAPACQPVSTAGSVAEADLALWRQRLACALPEGDGTVASRGDAVWRIAIRWKSREDGEPHFVTETVEVQL